MTDGRKVILILVDGLGADYFEMHRAGLPYLDGLARRGLQVGRLASVVPATSLPGRASMLAGCAADRHGIYGNQILDGDRFRGAEAPDLQAPSLARLATEAGLRVASVGFGLVAPEDTETFVSPWWSHDILNRRSNSKLPVGTSLGILPGRDPTGAARAVLGGRSLSAGAEIAEAQLHPQMVGMAADHSLLALAATLACGEDPPDLILAEIAVTDVLLHYHGYDSGAALWGFATADMMIGQLLHRLTVAGRAGDYLVAVASDHGHAPIERAFYADALLPDVLSAKEGGSLHVVHGSERERRAIERRLAELDIRPLPGEHLPESVRERIVTFTAPPGHGFEDRPDDVAPGTLSGSPTIVSTHGLRPGSAEDDRVCILAGAGVAAGRIERAPAESLAPTLAAALGLQSSAHTGAPLL